MTFDNLIRILERRAAETPDRLAYAFLDGAGEVADHLTYAGLLARTDAFARQLLAGARPGERALILYPPCLDYVVAFLACLRAGIVAVPAYPPRPSRTGRNLDRLLAVIEDCEAGICLMDRELLDKREFFVRQAPRLGGLAWVAEGVEARSYDGALPESEPERTAFLQYTSGSTSDPKGVIVSHGNIVANLASIRRAFDLDETSAQVSWLPPYHDMGLIGGILSPLFTGYPCHLMAPSQFIADPALWLEAVSRYGATVSGGPNFAFDYCTHRIPEERAATLDLSRWSVAFNGAEPVLAHTLKAFARRFAPAGFRARAFYPCYGMAEATLFVTGSEVAAEPTVLAAGRGAYEAGRFEPPPGEEKPVRLVSSGRTRDDIGLRAVDPETGLDVPEDRVGELWISGSAVTRGYWGKPEANARTFVQGEDGTRWCRTGDLGFLHGGELFVTGRLKELIIHHGRNYYPHDVEAAVQRSNPVFRPGCGAAFSDQEGGVTVVQEVGDRDADALEALCEAARARVAEEVGLPVGRIVCIRSGTLAKTSSGKIQRLRTKTSLEAGELFVIFDTAVGASAGGEEPAEEDRSPLLDRVGALLRERFGVRSRRIAGLPLTSLGVDSVQAMELKALLEHELGHPIPAEIFFDNLTVAELAGEIGRAGPERDPRPPSAAPSGPVLEAPLTNAQERILLACLIDPGSAAFNVPVSLELKGRLDEAAWAKAWTGLLTEQPILRTRIVRADGRFLQVPGDIRGAAAACAGPAADLREEGGSALELQARANRFFGAPFDIMAGPLARAQLLRLGEESWRLDLCLHHLVADAWSLALVVDGLARHYARALAGDESALPVDDRFFRYALREAEEDGAERRAGLARDYVRQLAEYPGQLALPLDHKRPSGPTYGGEEVRFRIDQVAWSRGQAIARELRLTPFNLLFSVFQVLIHAHSGQTRFVLGTDVANRLDLAAQGTLGLFTNQVAIPAQIRPEATLGETVQLLARAQRQALRYQEVPFGHLAQALGRDGGGGMHPVFQVLFVLENVPHPRHAFPGLEARLRRAPMAGSPFDLSAVLSPDGAGGIEGAFRFDDALFRRDTAEGFAADYQALLARGLAGGLDMRLADLVAGFRVERIRRARPERKELVLQKRSG